MQSTTMLAASTRRRAESDSRSAIAYQLLRDRILSLDLPPATLIDERRLAREMALGLTPVRQALRRLALENLVVILPRRGTIVADLDAADIDKIFEMRIELEALAARLAALRATPEQRTTLAVLAHETRLAQRRPDNATLIELDRRLHRALAEAAHNEFLLETLDRLYGHVLRLWNHSLQRVKTLDRSMEEHCRVIDAVRTGDADNAAAIMREHVQHFQREYLESRANDGEQPTNDNRQMTIDN